MKAREILLRAVTTLDRSIKAHDENRKSFVAALKVSDDILFELHACRRELREELDDLTPVEIPQ